MKSTASIFYIYLRHLPEILPANISAEANKITAEIENNDNLTLERLENLMINFGYQSWPWHKAYKEYLLHTTNQMFDHLVTPGLKNPLLEKFQKYRRYNIPSEGIFSGSGLHHYFNSEEMQALSGAIVEAKRHGAELTNRQIKGQHKERFLSRVAVLSDILTEIKKNLDRLKNMAAAENEHPKLADEIKAKIKDFEHGLVLLAPEPNQEGVKQSIDFFTGRKYDLNRLKGMHHPLTVNFYTPPIDPWFC